MSESRVRLQRLIPLMRNAFKPFFFGHFELRADGVYLSGRFTMQGPVKAFMTVWFGAIVMAGIALAVTRQGIVPMVSVLGMLGAGMAVVAVGRSFARDDIAWLSGVIRSALEDPASSEGIISRGPMSSEERTESAAAAIPAKASRGDMTAVAVDGFKPQSQTLTPWRRRASTAITIIMVCLLGFGFVRFPDAPLKPCDSNKSGFCGKQRQPHTEHDYKIFTVWQDALLWTWLPGMVAVAWLRKSTFGQIGPN